MPRVLSEFGNIIGVSNVDVQLSDMPVYTEYLLGQIVQYVGVTNATYTKGYFYERGVNSWVQCNVQPAGTASLKDVPLVGNASTAQVVLGDDTRLTDARNAADVYDWAKAANKPSYSANEISGLGTASTVDVTDVVASGSSALATSGAVYTAIGNASGVIPVNPASTSGLNLWITT